MITTAIGAFEIKGKKIYQVYDEITTKDDAETVITKQETEVKDIELINLIAKQLLETWWENRTLEIEGGTIKLDDSFNAKQLSLAVAIDQDADLVDIDDKTIIIPADRVKETIKQLKLETTRTMNLWDEWLAIIETGTKAQALKLIGTIAKLEVEDGEDTVEA